MERRENRIRQLRGEWDGENHGCLKRSDHWWGTRGGVDLRTIPVQGRITGLRIIVVYTFRNVGSSFEGDFFRLGFHTSLLFSPILSLVTRVLCTCGVSLGRTSVLPDGPLRPRPLWVSEVSSFTSYTPLLSKRNLFPEVVILIYSRLRTENGKRSTLCILQGLKGFRLKELDILLLSFITNEESYQPSLITLLRTFYESGYRPCFRE